MYFLYKTMSYVFSLLFFISFFYCFWLLWQGKSAVKKDLIVLFIAFSLSLLSVISYVFFAYNARQLYVNERNKEYIIKTVKFLGMEDGNFVKNSSPKDAYFTFKMNGKHYRTIIDNDLKDTVRKFRIGDEIVIKYIDGGLLERSIIITDIQQ